MGLQDMIRWILPREDVFYSMLESHSVLVVEAAQALAEFGRGKTAEQVHERVRDLEHKADSIVYEIEDQLARVFVTPIDREDIVDPPIRAHEGAIDVPWDRPGLGFDANLERIQARTLRTHVLEAERAPTAA